MTNKPLKNAILAAWLGASGLYVYTQDQYDNKSLIKAHTGVAVGFAVAAEVPLVVGLAGIASFVMPALTYHANSSIRICVPLGDEALRINRIDPTTQKELTDTAVRIVDSALSLVSKEPISKLAEADSLHTGSARHLPAVGIHPFLKNDDKELCIWSPELSQTLDSGTIDGPATVMEIQRAWTAQITDNAKAHSFLPG